MIQTANGWRRWRLWVLLPPVAIWAVWAWLNGELLLIRHFGQPAGSGPLSLSSAVLSTDSALAAAAGQRLAELGPAGLAADGAVRRRLIDLKPDSELGWLLGFTVSQWGEFGAGAMAIAVTGGHSQVETPFRELAPEARIAALLELLQSLDLSQPDQSERAASVSRWLGAAGPNAELRMVPESAIDPVRSPLVCPPPLERERATEVATAILRTYQGHEMPDAALGALVQLGEPAVGPLLQTLEGLWEADTPFEQRRRIYRVCHQLGILAQAAEPALVDAVQTEAVNLAFREALQALVAIQPLDRSSATAAVRAANDPARWEPLGYSVDLIASWCESAIQGLGSAETVAGLVAEFQRRDPAGDRTRPAAGSRRSSWVLARQLGELGPRAAAAEPVLRDALLSYWPEVRLEAALAVARVGGETGRSVEVLLELLDPTRHSPADIGLALVALQELEPLSPTDLARAQRSWSALLNTGPSPEVRQIAANSLHRFAPDSDEVTEQMVAALLVEADPPTRAVLRELLLTRMSQADLTGQGGLAAEQAISWLQSRWKPDSTAERTGEQELQVVLGLSRLRQQPEVAAVAMAEWLGSGVDFPPMAAAFFDSLGDSRPSALPTLMVALRSDNPRVVALALQRMAAMGSLGRPAYSAVAALETPDRLPVLRRLDPLRYVRSTRSWWAVAALVGPPLGGLALGLVAGWKRLRRPGTSRRVH